MIETLDLSGATAPPPRLPRAVAPVISVRCRASNVWISSEARAKAGVWLKNVGVEEARHVTITDLMIDGAVRCRFRALGHLEPGATVSLDPVTCSTAGGGDVEQTTLTALVSRTIVRQVLAGRQPQRRWVLQVTYENVHRRRYATRFAIEVVSFPLTLRVAPARSLPEVIAS